MLKNWTNTLKFRDWIYFFVFEMKMVNLKHGPFLSAAGADLLLTQVKIETNSNDPMSCIVRFVLTSLSSLQRQEERIGLANNGSGSGAGNDDLAGISTASGSCHQGQQQGLE